MCVKAKSEEEEHINVSDELSSEWCRRAEREHEEGEQEGVSLPT